MRTSHSGADDSAVTSDDRLFEWVDGPLVVAMLRGESFLLDEISLADDAVLERLNSLLEPERRICLAERCGGDNENETITAAPAFRLFATMNPGGDYAKKELSSALRNRFTEIWCPSVSFLSEAQSEVSNEEDWHAIVLHNFHRNGFSSSQLHLSSLAGAMVDFCRWFARGRSESSNGVFPGKKSGWCRRPPPTIRDLLAWVNFIQNLVNSSHDITRARLINACLHGAALLFLDSLESASEEEKKYFFTQGTDLLESLQSAWLGFDAVGGINCLLRCILMRSGEKEGGLSSQLLSDITLAAKTFVESLNLQPGHCLPVLKDSNRLYGCEPFFIEAGGSPVRINQFECLRWF